MGKDVREGKKETRGKNYTIYKIFHFYPNLLYLQRGHFAFFFFFGGGMVGRRKACRILVPQLGIEPGPRQ